MSTAKVNSVDLHVAARLRAARLERRISQERAAQALGVSFTQVQKYEKGINRITAGKLFQIAELYDKPLEWFFEGPSPPDKLKRARRDSLKR